MKVAWDGGGGGWEAERLKQGRDKGMGGKGGLTKMKSCVKATWRPTTL